MNSQYPKLAGYSSLGTVAALSGIVVGPDEINTDSAPALATIRQYELCVLLDNGVRPYAAADSALAPHKLVLAQHAAASGQRVGYYTSGKFNHNMMFFPAEVGTYALRKSLMGNGPLQIGHEKPPSA